MQMLSGSGDVDGVIRDLGCAAEMQAEAQGLVALPGDDRRAGCAAEGRCLVAEGDVERVVRDAAHLADPAGRQPFDAELIAEKRSDDEVPVDVAFRALVLLRRARETDRAQCRRGGLIKAWRFEV